MISVVAALALSAASVNGAFCHGKPAADAPANTHPINTEEAKLVRKSKNAILFEAGQPGYEFHVLHVYGTAYEVSLLFWRMLTRSPAFLLLF